MIYVFVRVENIVRKENQFFLFPHNIVKSPFLAGSLEVGIVL